MNIRFYLLIIYLFNFILSGGQTITNGLVAYYPFNGNAGDSSGMGNHGAVSNATVTTGRKGIANSAYYFNGTNAAITVAANSTIQPASALTIAAWISPEAKASGWSPVLTKRYSSNDPWNSYTLITHTSFNKKWSLGMSSGATGSLGYWMSRDTMSFNNWFFLVATYNGSSVKIYYNGVLDTTLSTSIATIGYSSLPLYIGYTGGVNTEYYKGKIDEISIYNRALSANEVMQLFAPFENIYYSKSTGKLDSLGTWGKNTDGTGVSPANFNASNTAYVVVNNSSPTINGNWFVTGSNTAIIFGDATNMVNFTVPNGMMVGADSIVLRNNSTLTMYGVLQANRYYFENGSTAQYFSNGSQSIPGANFNNLVTFGTNKNLLGDVRVRSNLVLLSSVLTNGYTLTLGSGPTQRGFISGNGTIWGKLARWFGTTTNSGDTGLFPISTAGGTSRPLKIDFTIAPSQGGTLTAEFISSAPGNNFPSNPYFDFSMSPPIPLNKTSPNGYWKLISGNGLTGGTYSVTATGTGFWGINSLDSLRLVYRSNSSSAWATNNVGTSVAGTGSIGAPIVKRNGIQSLGGEFAIASDSNTNTLPVKLVSFTAEMGNNNSVLLTWQTAWEDNFSHFEIERTYNDIFTQNWEHVGTINGNENSAALSNYRFCDDFSQHKAAYGDRIFYRLKQVDLNGRFEYSEIVKIVPIHDGSSITFFPNPVKDVLTVSSSSSVLLFELFDSSGKMVISKANAQTIELKDLSKGVYVVKIQTERASLTERIVLE